MNSDDADYPRYLWDRQWWKYLDVLGGAKRKVVPDAAAVYDRLVQYVFAGEIAWECVLHADSLEKAKRGLAWLFERMADELTTSEQLQGLLTSMNSASRAEGGHDQVSGSHRERRRDLGKPGARKTWGTAFAERLARRPHLCRRDLVPGWGTLLGAKSPRRGATRSGSWADSLGRSVAPGKHGPGFSSRVGRRRWLPCEDVVMERSAERRVGRNEGIFREANEAIKRGLWPGEEHGEVRFRCECARLECSSTVEFSLSEYERVRGNPRWFVLLPGHELSEVDVVVERRPGYVVVEKRGRAGAIAESEDPRS